MFHTIKHLPTNTWVPQLSSPKDRSLYYMFLENKIVKIPFNLDFYKAFKYKDINKAEEFIKYVSTKLQNKEIIFKIFSFDVWPIEYINLLNPEGKGCDYQIFHLNEEKENWFNISFRYCSKCGIYIPPKLKYIQFLGKATCALCALEMFEALKLSLETFTDKELLNAMDSARFTNQL